MLLRNNNNNNNNRKFCCFFLVLFPVGYIIFLFWPSLYRVSSFDNCLALCLPRLVHLTLTRLSVHVLGLLKLNCYVHDYGLTTVAPTSLCLCPGWAFQHLSGCLCVRVRVSTFNMYHSLSLSGCSLLTQ